MNAVLERLADLTPAMSVTLFVRGSAITLAAALVVRSFSRTSAATRHAVWTLAIVALGTVPLAMNLASPWTVLSPVAGAPMHHPVLAPVPITPAQQSATASPAGSGPTAAPMTDPRARGFNGERLLGLLFLVWLAGAVTLLVRLVLHLRAASGLVRRAVVVRGGSIATVLRHVGQPDVRIALSGETSVPLVSGVRRQSITLPASAEHWPTDLLRSVLLHEIAHLQRRDYVVHLVTRVVVALYWPNPFVWFGARRLAAEQERACDDRALRGSSPQAYAGHLLDVTLMLRRTSPVPAIALAMTGKRALVERFRSILNTATDRRPLSWPRLIAGSVLVALVAIPAAMLRIRQAPAPDPHLFAALEAPDHGRRQRAAWALGEMESRAGVVPLLASLGDPHPAVRGTAAWALGEIKDRRAVGALVARLERDDDPLVRELAAIALGEIGARAAGIPLHEAAGRDAAMIPAVLWALGEIDHASAERAVRELRFDAPDAPRWIEGDEVAKESAARGRESGAILALGRNRDAGGVGAALAALAAGDPELRAQAAWTLGRIGEVRAVAPLLVAMRDPEMDVRAVAIWALDEINPTRAAR